MTNNTRRRLPAEWEHHNAILMAWPHAGTDWSYMLSEAEECFSRLIHAITRYERVVLVTPDTRAPARYLSDIAPDRLLVVECDTNDTWARDFGPITIETPRGERCLDFKFNGWGLKFASDRDNLINRHLEAGSILPHGELLNRLNFVLEGGSIESNGEGIVMTTAECLLSPNRNGEWDRDRIDRHLREELGADEILWIDHGAISGDDTDSHIDTLARFASPDTILYVAPPADTSDPDHQPLAMMEAQLKSTGFHIVALPYAGPVFDPDDRHRLPATYANFLITPRAVFVPVYGLPTDAEATDIISRCFPERHTVAVDCRALIRQHGSLHCVTMQLRLK